MTNFLVKHSSDGRHFDFYCLAADQKNRGNNLFPVSLVRYHWDGGLVEMTSVSEEDVQRWFDVALQWGSADTSEKCRDTFECLDELHVFLKQLENALEGLVCMY